MQNKLYSFRRCPYAIRARITLIYSKINFTIVEVDLKNKPIEMLKISPKSTVPVLQTVSGEIIDESLDIMYWALQKSDQDKWLPSNPREQELSDYLISRNDNHFKWHLDRFKYPNRYTEEKTEKLAHKTEVANYFIQINKLLEANTFLAADRITIADIAVFPFIRQAANIDKLWFDKLNLNALYIWFDYFSQSMLFRQSMKKITN